MHQPIVCATVMVSYSPSSLGGWYSLLYNIHDIGSCQLCIVEVDVAILTSYPNCRVAESFESLSICQEIRIKWLRNGVEH